MNILFVSLAFFLTLFFLIRRNLRAKKNQKLRKIAHKMIDVEFSKKSDNAEFPPTYLEYSVDIQKALHHYAETFDFTKKHKRKNDKKEKEKQRLREFRKKVDIVFSFANTVDLCSNLSSFYDFENLDFESINRCIDEAVDISSDPNYKDIVAKYLLVLQKEYHQERPSYVVLRYIKNPKDYKIDKDLLLQNAFDRWRDHFESALSSYKNKNAYLNRLQYLINYIEELLEKPYIKNNPYMVDQLIALQDKYKRLFNE